jgi:hypothetical protein
MKREFYSIWQGKLMKSLSIVDAHPITHPTHWVLGWHLVGHSLKHSKTTIWYCEAHDGNGYWLWNVDDWSDHRNGRSTPRSIASTTTNPTVHARGRSGAR